MKITFSIYFLICSTLLLAACSQSPEEPAARADSGGSKNAVQKTTSPKASASQPKKREIRTVNTTVNDQWVVLYEIDSPLMNLPLAEVRKRATAKDPDAVYELARRYMKGIGLAKDPARAIPLLKQAAAAGSPDAQHDLAGLYELGNLGFRKDQHKAFELYRKAADQGEPLSQWNLSLSYYYGKGTRIDYKKSLELAQKAADQGIAAALVHIGWLYADGLGVKKISTKPCHCSTRRPTRGKELHFTLLANSMTTAMGFPRIIKKPSNGSAKAKKSTIRNA